MKLYYIFDPLCVFSYGFNHLIKNLYEDCKEMIEFEFIAGGLWQGDGVKIVSAQMKENLIKASNRVTELSGQGFGDAFYNRLSEGYKLDSEICSRIFQIIKQIKFNERTDLLTDLFDLIFVEGIDVNNLENYEKLLGISNLETLYNSDEIITKTRNGFIKSRELGVKSYPTLLLDKKGELLEYQLNYSNYDDLYKWFKDNV